MRPSGRKSGRDEWRVIHGKLLWYHPFSPPPIDWLEFPYSAKTPRAANIAIVTREATRYHCHSGGYMFHRSSTFESIAVYLRNPPSVEKEMTGLSIHQTRRERVSINKKLTKLETTTGRSEGENKGRNDYLFVESQLRNGFVADLFAVLFEQEET